MFTICQVYYLIVGGVFYKNVGSLWKVSDCEEIDMCIVVSGTCPTCSVLKVWK